MAMNKAGGPHIEKRMTQVAVCVAAKMTQRQIVEALANNGIVNPETNEPYSLGTINSDIKALKKEWKARRSIETDEWVAEEIASLDELERKAWTGKDYDLVLRIKTRRAKMLGLDAAVTQNINVDLTKLSDDQLKRIAEGKLP
jgi:hypothetical protein